MTSTPLITIGITAYNAADTIQAAVDSALAQKWPEKEIIVVDDCSDDDTYSLIEKVARAHKSVRVFRQKENGGVAAARNRIIKEATGMFIAFFDDDDESSPDRLTKQYDRIAAYEKAFSGGAPVLCYTARTQFYPDGHDRYEPTMGMDESAVGPNGPAVAYRILFGRPLSGGFGSLATCSQMARRKTYTDIGGFDESFKRCEDTEFNIRFAMAGGHFAGLPEPLVKQMMTYGSDKTIEAEKRFYLACLEKHRSIIEAEKPYGFCYKWIEAKYDFLAGRKVAFVMKFAGLLLRYPLSTVERLIWSLPNRRYNRQAQSFYKSFYEGEARV